VAIVAGVRTPFAKSGTTLKKLTAIELGKHCVAELIQRSDIDGKLVEMIVYGTVVPSVVAPNIAREVSLLPMLPKGVQSFTVSRACASANQAITDAADQIALGGVALERPDPALARHERGARQRLEGEVAGWPREGARRRAAARPRPHHPRHLRAVDERDDGRVG
jgi:hypothetical protein